jgi:dynein heavy chain, axonemal
MQVTMNEATQNYLRDTFVPQLQRAVTSSLERAGKGWFNVHERNHATYEHSKLRKLLTAVRFMMEDTLRTLVINSVNVFERFMLNACDVDIQIRGTDSVKITSSTTVQFTPLIALDLQLDGDPKRIDFSDDVDMLPDQMVSLLTRSVSGTEGLAQLEPMVMTELYWAYKPKLATVGLGEELIQLVKGTVHAAWSKIVAALRKYRCSS